MAGIHYLTFYSVCVIGGDWFHKVKWDQNGINFFWLKWILLKVKAHRLYDEVNQIEGAFFLAAAYGFQGRLYGDRGQYLKSFTGR